MPGSYWFEQCQFRELGEVWGFVLDLMVCSSLGSLAKSNLWRNCFRWNQLWSIVLSSKSLELLLCRNLSTLLENETFSVGSFLRLNYLNVGKTFPPNYRAPENALCLNMLIALTDLVCVYKNFFRILVFMWNFLFFCFLFFSFYLRRRKITCKK